MDYKESQFIFSKYSGLWGLCQAFDVGQASTQVTNMHIYGISKENLRILLLQPKRGQCVYCSERCLPWERVSHSEHKSKVGAAWISSRESTRRRCDDRCLGGRSSQKTRCWGSACEDPYFYNIVNRVDCALITYQKGRNFH